MPRQKQIDVIHQLGLHVEDEPLWDAVSNDGERVELKCSKNHVHQIDLRQCVRARLDDAGNVQVWLIRWDAKGISLDEPVKITYSEILDNVDREAVRAAEIAEQSRRLSGKYIQVLVYFNAKTRKQH